MRVSAKERESRSRERQSVAKQLAVWVQREKDMEVAASRRESGVPEKVIFIRQEQAKLRKTLRILDRGVSIQRAWANGKLIY